jgi:beta-lactamase regulating signal transducer with metallopeptidase domain
MSALHALLTSDAVYRLGWALLHSIWLGAGVFAVLTLMMGLLRRGPANARYLLSCAALAAVPAATVGAFVLTQPRARVSAPTALVIGNARASQTASIARGPSMEGRLTPPNRAVAAPAQPEAWPARTVRAVEPALPWAVVAWGAGVLLMVVWQLAGWTEALRIRRLATPPSEPGLMQTVERLARAMNVTNSVAIVQSMIVNVPTLIGWLRPMILLPAELVTGLPAEQLEAILLHELAHVRRMDYLVNLLHRLVEAVFFYHPAVWVISRRIRAERENCCDDATLAACGDPTVYAEALLAVAGPRAPRLAMAANGGQLLPRIRRILGLPSSGSSPPAVASGGLGLVLIAAMVVLPMACSVSPQKALPNVKAKVAAKKDVIRVADGQIETVRGNECSINLGQADQISVGMTFEVYDRHKGIPPVGDGTSNPEPPRGPGRSAATQAGAAGSAPRTADTYEHELPKGKGSIEIINVGADHTSTCRFIHVEPGETMSQGDIIANLVYDRNIKRNFVVYGDFDLSNNSNFRAVDAAVIRRLIQQWGGHVQPIVDPAHPADSVTREINFVIVGKEPVIPNVSAAMLNDPGIAMIAEQAKVRQAAYQAVLAKAADFGVPVMNQSRFLYYTGYFDQARR